MPVTSRVTSPLSRVPAREGQALKEQTGGTEQAIAGNGKGVVNVISADSGTSAYGMVWIRLIRGINPTTGGFLTTPPIRAQAKSDFYSVDGMPIRVSVDAVSGLHRVEGNDVGRASEAGVNVNGLNAQAPATHKRWLRDIRNMKPFIASTNTTNATKIAIEPYLYAYNGVLKDATKGISNDIDLASYIPTNGLERLVGIAIKAIDNSVQIVSGSTRTISAANWSLSDLQALYDQLDSDAMPSYVIRLADAQDTITMSDVILDWRQFINVPNQTTTGAVQVISSTGYTITQDAHFIAPVKLTGDLTVSGQVTIL